MAKEFIKTKFLLTLCILVATVLISGCTIGPSDRGGAGGPGLMIEKFQTSLNQIDSGERVALRLEVRNRGDYNGPLGMGVPAVAEIMEIDPYEWQIVPSTIVDLGTLLAPDREMGTEGGLATADWQLLAPYLQKGQTKSYSIRARVYYPYQTKAIKPVTFVTAEELRRIVQLGDSLPAEATTQTSGPISVDIIAGKFVKANEYQNSKFQLQIKITNSGGGQIRGENYPVALEVKWPQWVQPVAGYCPAQQYWITPIFNDVPTIVTPIIGTYVYLWDGKQGEITCDFQITQPPASRTVGNFEVTVGYLYSVDATTQITVRGIQEY
ncbi:MAG: hypothetical protein QXO27_04455 [Candidatus Aenigmatarchaeota archaeon]